LLEKLALTEDLLWCDFCTRIQSRHAEIARRDCRASAARQVHGHAVAAASRSVLARMKRGSNGEAFLKLLERIRTTIPGVSLRTSFIVGFPGETENDLRSCATS